jgi:small subunit ribosomal protein S4
MMFGRYHKKYSKPRKMYDKARIEEENDLVKTYGLKNKREIWKADAAIATLRNRAKALIGKDLEKQEKFIEKLKGMGFKAGSIADVLALNKEDYLKRRLQSVVFMRHIAKTPKQARQFVTHKKVVINKRVVNIPSYIVRTDEEESISLKGGTK